MPKEVTVELCMPLHRGAWIAFAEQNWFWHPEQELYPGHLSSSISSPPPNPERANQVSENPNETFSFPGALRDHMTD